ncbi:MAG: Gfo/Idh/MocA family protein [Thermoanaerobaculia bacterium]
MTRTRVGVVGTGYLGARHTRVLTEIPEAHVVGFVELNDAHAAEIIATHNLERFDSVDALAKEIECAVVATPTTNHFDVASQLLQSGVDVMIEKPITATVDEARRLIEIAEKHGRIVQVGHVERYHPAITAVAEMVRESRYVELDRLGVFSGRSTDIDVLLDLLIHDINLVLSLLQKKVIDVRAVGVPVITDKVDMAKVWLELENGAVATLTASRVAQDPVRKQRFFGSDFYVSVDTARREVKGRRLVRENGACSLQNFDLSIENKEPLRAENESFLQCVRDRSRPIVSGQDGLEAVALADRVRAAIDAAEKRFRA